MTVQKRTKSGDMPGLEGMGPRGTAIVVVVVLSLVPGVRRAIPWSQ